MPLLKQILSNTTNSKEYRVLRGKTIECISFIGVAVGKEKFHEDAKSVMQLMLQNGIYLFINILLISYTLYSWAS